MTQRRTDAYDWFTIFWILGAVYQVFGIFVIIGGREGWAIFYCIATLACYTGMAFCAIKGGRRGP